MGRRKRNKYLISKAKHALLSNRGIHVPKQQTRLLSLGMYEYTWHVPGTVNIVNTYLPRCRRKERATSPALRAPNYVVCRSVSSSRRYWDVPWPACEYYASVHGTMSRWQPACEHWPYDGQLQFLMSTIPKKWRWITSHAWQTRDMRSHGTFDK